MANLISVERRTSVLGDGPDRQTRSLCLPPLTHTELHAQTGENPSNEGSPRGKAERGRRNASPAPTPPFIPSAGSILHTPDGYPHAPSTTKKRQTTLHTPSCRGGARGYKAGPGRISPARNLWTLRRLNSARQSRHLGLAAWLVVRYLER